MTENLVPITQAKVGWGVHHPTFGDGIITRTDGNVVYAAFPGFGARQIHPVQQWRQKPPTEEIKKIGRALPLICATDWHQKPIVPQGWHVPGLIPQNTVTILAGVGA